MLEPLTALAAAFLRSEGVVGSSLSAQDAASYVSASPSSQALSAVGRLGDIECKYLNLAQQWLQTYLPWVLSKVNRVSYGTLAPEELRSRESRGRKLLAVPFIGKDVPFQLLYQRRFQQPLFTESVVLAHDVDDRKPLLDELFRSGAALVQVRKETAARELACRVDVHYVCTTYGRRGEGVCDGPACPRNTRCAR